MKFQVKPFEDGDRAYVVQSSGLASQREAEKLAARCNLLDELERLAREADVALTIALRQVDEAQHLVAGDASPAPVMGPSPLAIVGQLAISLEWALDLIDMYDAELIRRGDPTEVVKSAKHEAGKAKARALLDPAVGSAQPKADDSPVSITLNGKKITVPRELSYEKIIQLAGEPGASVTFRHPERGRSQGIVSVGQTIQVQEGTIINAYWTGGA